MGTDFGLFAQTSLHADSTLNEPSSLPLLLLVVGLRQRRSRSVLVLAGQRWAIAQVPKAAPAAQVPSH